MPSRVTWAAYQHQGPWYFKDLDMKAIGPFKGLDDAWEAMCSYIAATDPSLWEWLLQQGFPARIT